ncbi:MAG: DUF4115 domain-containing protein [Nitrospinae bacterium]|nr:DUF4115 domain-containing protein [Nitrospinota bacterium]
MENLDPRLMAQIEKEGVGPFLRHMREEAGLSLRSISEHTRIRTYYLESIEKGEFDKLPTGPVGLGFIRAFADSVGADSQAVVANYKRETAGGVPADEYGLESETQILFSSPPRANRFSSVATFAFVLIFLLAGGGMLWFMKGRTEQLVPVGSIVGRIKTAVAPVAEKLPRLNGANEKAKNEAAAREETGDVEKETGDVEKEVPEQVRPPVSAVDSVDSEEPPVSDEQEKPFPAEEKPPVQVSTPARESPVATDGSRTQESPPAQESPPVQAQAPRPVQEPPAPRDEPSVRESPPASQTPSTQEGAPAEQKVALNTAPNTQTPPQGQQAPAASIAVNPAPTTPATPEELPLTLKIFAAEDTWLRIVVDAKNTEELLLLAGNERNWKASEKFTLTVGNIAGTQVSLNGAEIALPRNSSNVLRDFVIPRKSLN